MPGNYFVVIKINHGLAVVPDIVFDPGGFSLDGAYVGPARSICEKFSSKRVGSFIGIDMKRIIRMLLPRSDDTVIKHNRGESEVPDIVVGARGNALSRDDLPKR